jgi:hypothetical protein
VGGSPGVSAGGPLGGSPGQVNWVIPWGDFAGGDRSVNGGHHGVVYRAGDVRVVDERS